MITSIESSDEGMILADRRTALDARYRTRRSAASGRWARVTGNGWCEQGIPGGREQEMTAKERAATDAERQRQGRWRDTISSPPTSTNTLPAM